MNPLVPAPVTMTPRTRSSFLRSWAAWWSWLTTSSFSAFSLSGRFTLSVATPSLTMTRRLGKFMAENLAWA
jgi:hypothetical protein